jgi:galactose mutarotase-like enzyme
MPQHGFARDRAFTVVERGEASVRLRLDSDDETLARYPWPFRLDVTVALSETALDLAFAVSNRGGEPMPYGLGFHPAFPWPFDASDLAGHAVAFEAPERAVVPLLTPDGLLRRETRSLPLDGARLPLAPELFAPGAMAFLDARSRSMRFVSPSGSAIALSGEGWPHLALWTKPSAPFLSMELWTAHADWEDFDGELTERPSLIALEPGETREHRLRMEWEAG